jgi:hypothetical protein
MMQGLLFLEGREKKYFLESPAVQPDLEGRKLCYWPNAENLKQEKTFIEFFGTKPVSAKQP